MNSRDRHFFLQFFSRVLASILIVLATYNPTGYSYFHWIRNGFETNLPLKALVGLVLLISYVVLIRATLYSIRIVGVVLVGLLVAAIVWSMTYYGVLSLTQPGVLDWIILIGVGFILGVGLSWAIIRRRLSGQYTVDEAEHPDSA